MASLSCSSGAGTRSSRFDAPSAKLKAQADREPTSGFVRRTSDSGQPQEVKLGQCIDLGGAAWCLLPERAAWWEAQRTLVLADVHFGKAASFRAQGVPVPRGTTDANLRRLSALIEALDARRVIFLGDLFHSRHSYAPDTVAALTLWRRSCAGLECVLVEGNHDRAAGQAPAELLLRVEAEPYRLGQYAFCHEPRFVPGALALAGHLHPCIHLQGRADSLRLPCFWVRAALMVLPSFGEFTGGAGFEREAGDRVFAVAEDALFEIPRR